MLLQRLALALAHLTYRMCEKLMVAMIGPEKIVVQQQIDAPDRQIDWLVYELYRLIEEKINIVEEGTAL